MPGLSATCSAPAKESNVPSFRINAANGAIILGALLVRRVSPIAPRLRGA